MERTRRSISMLLRNSFTRFVRNESLQGYPGGYILSMQDLSDFELRVPEKGGPSCLTAVVGCANSSAISSQRSLPLSSAPASWPDSSRDPRWLNLTVVGEWADTSVFGTECVR